MSRKSSRASTRDLESELDGRHRILHQYFVASEGGRWHLIPPRGVRVGERGQLITPGDKEEEERRRRGGLKPIKKCPTVRELNQYGATKNRFILDMMAFTKRLDERLGEWEGAWRRDYGTTKEDVLVVMRDGTEVPLTFTVSEMWTAGERALPVKAYLRETLRTGLAEIYSKTQKVVDGEPADGTYSEWRSRCLPNPDPEWLDRTADDLFETLSSLKHF